MQEMFNIDLTIVSISNGFFKTDNLPSSVLSFSIELFKKKFLYFQFCLKRRSGFDQRLYILRKFLLKALIWVFLSIFLRRVLEFIIFTEYPVNAQVFTVSSDSILSLAILRSI